MERPTSRSKSDRFFYINVARNIARDGATTHFLLASDIELYPSVDLVPQFLTMLARSGGVTLHPRTVYVLAPFEVTVDTKPPQNKMELQALLEDQLAIRFHQGMCDRCHRIPSPELWEISSPDRGRRFSLCCFADISVNRFFLQKWESLRPCPELVCMATGSHSTLAQTTNRISTKESLMKEDSTKWSRPT